MAEREPLKRTVTTEQANEALRALVANPDGGDEPQPEPAPEPQVETPEPVAEPAPAAADASVEAETPAEGDDVASLRKRLDERDQEVKRVTELHEQRLKDIQERSMQNQQALRQRFLKKSTAAERALQILKGTRSKDGVPETEVDRVIAEIEATMNPASSSYVAPTAGPTPSEDQLITFNNFLDEKGMSNAESAEFGRWIQAEAATKLSPRELAVSERDLDGFLRIAHVHWSNGMRADDKAKVQTDAVAAVKAVKQVQSQAARAATVPSAPRKQPTAAADKPTTYAEAKKMTPEARQKWVSDMVKASIEEYR